VSDPTGPKSRDGFVVASPLLSQTGEVIGGLCACRRFKRADTGRLNVVRLQSQLLELISCAVASALLRIEQEKRSKTLQRQFDQFFTKKLSQHLKLQPDLLEGRDAEVSLLFCDIRDFTRHSDHLQASQIFSWINDVMETLSQCVLRYDGVLVDYIGDELVAMWGAPEHQPNHAVLACQAAMEMMQALPQLNERWSSVLRRPLEVGIGINTGPVRVGNTGSQQKFKYGPLGTTVNIASRVQGATKYLDCPVLLAETTFLQLGEGFRTRELCQVRLVNLDRPIRIYELADATGCSQEVCAQYEQALATFARGQLETASGLLGRVLQQHPNDGPCRILLKRTLEYLIDENLKFDPAWSLPGK
jgi:adenylate cyclase